MPPCSLVSSVYCASPSLEAGEIVGEHALEQLVGCRAFDVELTHVRDVEDADVGSHRLVLGDHALVLHRHLPPREGDETCAGGGVAIEQRGALQRHSRIHERGL